MRSIPHAVFMTAIGLFALAACKVDVNDQGKDKNFDMRTPFGDISVRSGEDPPQTGLPVYPGAQAMRDSDEDHENADVNIGGSLFRIHVAAAKYESKDAPQAIIDFYKDKLSAHGTVLECKGDIEFDDESKQPVCENKPSSDEVELVSGTEEDHRLVSVKPRGQGSEFALVSIQIGEKG